MPSEACQFYGRTRMKRVGLEIESFKTICGPIPFLKDYHAGTPSSPAGLHVNWIPSWAQGKKPGHGSSNQTGLFVPYSREMAPHSRVRAWRTPGTEEPGGLPSVGSYRVGHDQRDSAAAAAAAEARVFKQPNLSFVILLSHSGVTGSGFLVLTKRSSGLFCGFCPFANLL